MSEESAPLGICDNDPNVRHHQMHTCQNWRPASEEEIKKRSALTTKNSELGKFLIAEAQKQYNEDRQEIVLNEVQRLIRARDEYQAGKDKAEKAIAFYNRKIAAIEAGQFEITTGANFNSDYIGGIKFQDAELNRANY